MNPATSIHNPATSIQPPYVPVFEDLEVAADEVVREPLGPVPRVGEARDLPRDLHPPYATGLHRRDGLLKGGDGLIISDERNSRGFPSVTGTLPSVIL